MSWILKFRSDNKGQAMIEFALVFPFLMLFILGIIEFGWLLNGQITLNSEAREGARVGAVVTTDRQTKVNEAVEETANLSGLTIISSPVALENDPVINKYNVVVTVNGRMTPIVGLFVTDDINMDAVAKMRRE